MLLNTFTISTGKTSFDVKTPVQKLSCKMVFEADTIANLGGADGGLVSSAALINAFFAAANGKVTVTKYSSNGDEKIMQAIPLKDLAEICANNEGFVNIKRTLYAAGCTSYQAFFTLDLSMLGNIPLANGEFLRVDYEGFSVYNVGARAGLDATIETYLMSGVVNHAGYLQYKRYATQANQPFKFNCESASFILVPWETDRLQLNCIGGAQPEWRATELEALASDTNDIVYIAEGIVFPFMRWRSVPAQAAIDGTVQTTIDSAIYVLTNKEK